MSQLLAMAGESIYANVRLRLTANRTYGLALPDWQVVITRDYEPWDSERLVLDSATLSVAQSVDKIVAALR